jgi:hypothetical protein
MTRVLISILTLIFIVACPSGTQMLRKIEPGMSPQEVDAVMGRRDGFSAVQRDGDNFVLYQYINRLCNAHVNLHEQCDFYVIFKNDHVIETGAKDVRSSSPSMQFLYIFRQPSWPNTISCSIS